MIERRIGALRFSALCLCLALLSACSDNPTNGGEELTLEQKIYMTPRTNADAERMAIFLSGELLAPDGLYRELVDDIQKFKEQQREEFPILDWLGFRPHRMNNYLGLHLTDSAVEELRLGHRNRALDSLSNLFKAGRLDISRMFDTTGYYSPPEFIALNFDGRYHADSLAVRYEMVAGVFSASPGAFIGGGSNLLPWKVDGSRVFLLKKGWGDCPAGCIGKQYYYFTKNLSSYELVASWGSNGGEIPAELESIFDEIYLVYRSGSGR